jgi:homocysteine S-methyltransferase
VYDVRVFEEFVRRVEHCRIPILVGILPLRSLRNAEFLTNEVPGMAVPTPILERLARAGDAESGKEIGIEIAQEALEASLPIAHGVYVMPPFGNVTAAVRVIEVVPESRRAPRPVA